MKNQRSTSLQIRLACITILGLLIALAVLAYLSGREVERDSDLIAQDAVPGTIHAHYMRMAMSRSIGWALAAASAQSAESRDASLKTVHAADAAFAEELKQYEATIRVSPANDRELLERLKKNEAELSKQLKAYEALILAGDRDAADAFLERELLPVFIPAIKSAEDLIKYNHANSITFAHAIRRSVNQLYWVEAIVVVLALVCAVVLVFNLTIRRRELAELQENEEKFSKAFRSNPIGIAITDIETGRYIEVNDCFCRIMGYAPQEVIGHTTHDKNIWNTDKECARILQPLLSGGTLHTQEILARTRYGVRKNVSLNAELIELGGRRCMMTLIEDITERKQMERRQTELAAIVESSEDAIIGKSMEGIITNWNRGAEKIFGYTAAEAIGQPLLMLIPPELAHEEEEILSRIARGETVQHFETERICKDGRRIHISATFSPLQDRHEKVIGASKIARDITAQKRTESKLRESEELFRSSFESAITGVCLVTKDGRFFNVNRTLCEMLGYTKEELLQLNVNDVTHEQDKEISRSFLGKVLTGGSQSMQVEKRYLHKDGHVVWALLSTAVIDRPQEHGGYLIAHIQDITQRKEAKEALARTTELLERTSAMAKVGGWELDLASQRVTWSAETARIHEVEFPFEQPLLEKGIDFYGPEAWPVIEAAVQAAIANGTSYDLESPFITAKGNHIWVRVQGFAVIEDGKTTRLRGTFQDITERIQAEAVRTQAEKQFSAAFKTSLDAQYIATLEEGRIIEVNDAFEDVFGYTREHVIGKTSLELDLYRNPSERAGMVAELKASNHIRNRELLIRRQDGKERTVSISISVLQLNGQPHILGAVSDITAQKQADEALRDKQAQLLLAMDIAKLAYWEFDVVNNIVTADEHIFQLLGSTSEQEGGPSMSPEDYIRKFVHPEDAGIVAHEVALGIATDDPNFARQFQHRIIRRDGSERVMLVRCRILMDAGGRTGKILGTNQDITEQKNAELRIWQLNRIHSVLSAINQTIVHEKDPQGMLTKACQIAVEKGGFRMAWIGMHDAAAYKLQPVASAGVVEGYLDLVNIDLSDPSRSSGPSGRCFFSAEHITCNDMEHDPLLAPWREEALKRGYRSSACFPLKVGGAACGVFTLYSDKTRFFNEEEMLLLDELAMDISFALEVSEGEAKRRQAEKELRWRTAFFEAQVHSAIDGILVVDSEGRKLLQNRRMNELWKIPPLIADDPDDSKQVQFVLGQVREPQVFAEKIAHLNAHPDESSTDVIELLDGATLERHSAPVRGSDGTYYGRVWTFHDITERKKLEQQFLRAQRMDSIGTLASGVAHDLNNILTPIMMSVAVLRLGMPAEQRDALCDTIQTSAARGAQIVKQVLTFGRGLEGEKHPLQMELVIDEVEQMIRSTFPKNITLECVKEPHLRLVLGDATQLHQVLLNLCVNARDAMSQGGKLRMSIANLDIDTSYASMLPELTPGPHVLLEVKDTGSGIPPEILERIFDPFFTTKGFGKGTGLGLSTVHGIVKSHGGSLKVTSTPGQGTTFQVYLPAALDQAAVADAAACTQPPTGHEELVLVVDDEPAIAQAARNVLEAHGYRVLLAGDPSEALVLFTGKSQEIAVVLTDIMMPVMSGAQLVRTLQQIKPTVRVIASSGMCDPTQIEAMRALGVEAFLNKPYNSSTLLCTISGALHPKQQAAPSMIADHT